MNAISQLKARLLTLGILLQAYVLSTSHKNLTEDHGPVGSIPDVPDISPEASTPDTFHISAQRLALLTHVPDISPEDNTFDMFQISAQRLALLTHVPDISPEVGYPHWRFSWFFSQPPCKRRSPTLNYTCFHISKSLFTVF